MFKIFDKIRKALKLYEQVKSTGIDSSDLLNKLSGLKQFIMIGED